MARIADAWGTLMAVVSTDHQIPASRTLATAILSPRVRRALENQLQIALSELDRKLPAVLLETELHLGRQCEQSSLQKLQVAAFESARLLRAAQAGLIKYFLQELEAGLANLDAPRDSRSLEDMTTAPSQGLALVDDSESNEGSVLANIALRSDSRNSLALQLMGHRYGVLAGAPAFDAEHLPLGSHALCHALRNAALAAGLSADVRLLLYRQFEQVVMPHYPALLDTLNARLAQDGILPYLNFVPVRVRPAADTNAPATRALDSRNSPASAGNAGNPNKSHPAATFAQSRTNQAPASAAGGAPRQDAFAALQDLLASRRMLLAKLRPGGNDERVREPLAREEVLDAVRRMRSNSAKAGNVTEIRQTLLAQSRQMHGHGVTLTDADSDSFELINLFMAQLQREMRDGPGIALIERLKLPLLQLGLREHRLFVDATHPARILLNSVSLAGAHWLCDDDIDAQWLGLLQRAVSMVQDDTEASHDIFVTANHALQGGLLAAARKNEMAGRRQVEAAIGREKLDLARQRAAAEITRLVDGRPLPRFHAVLLDQPWADVLSLTLLRHGEDSDAWRELRDATAVIVEAGITAGAKTIDISFVKRLQDVLGQVGYHAEDANAIACQLAKGRVEDDDQGSRTELILQLKARARLGGDDATQVTPSPPRTPHEQQAYTLLAGVTDACWLDILDPAEQRVIRRRLGWVSPRSGQALILNRRGQRISSDSLDSLARRMAADELQMVETDTHPAEAAWQTIFANLARIAGDESAQDASHG